MKKVCSILVLIFLCVFTVGSFSGCTPRNEQLLIHNWGEYMAEDVYKVDFPKWYKEKTGKNIEVKYTTFDLNEDMYTEVNLKQKDYDLVCPSDYMIQKMINENLLIPFDKSIVDTSVIKPQLMEMTQNSYDKELLYSVPYVWGTLGIMYDTTKVTNRAEMKSWNALFGDTYSQEMLIKNSIRDVYAMANIYNNSSTLSALSSGFTDYTTNPEYKKKMESIFSDVSPATIAAVKKTLQEQRGKVIDYSNDEGKDELVTGNTKAKLGLFWSCDAGYAMYENTDLYYEVPKEGSNVWVDSFVIPKYAQNTEAANLFLQYICEKDVALKNMAYIGAASPVEAAMDEYKIMLQDAEEQDELFAGIADMNKADRDAFIAQFIEMFFPSDDVLARCQIMTDFGTASEEIDKMFIDIKK